MSLRFAVELPELDGFAWGSTGWRANLARTGDEFHADALRLRREPAAYEIVRRLAALSDEIVTPDGACVLCGAGAVTGEHAPGCVVDGARQWVAVHDSGPR